MNVYAIKGTKVYFTKDSVKNGNEFDKKMIKNLINGGKLKLNTPYTVEETLIST